MLGDGLSISDLAYYLFYLLSLEHMCVSKRFFVIDLDIQQDAAEQRIKVGGNPHGTTNSHVFRLQNSTNGWLCASFRRAGIALIV
jgi:hypothetical protein